jgi:hypothetical protein
MLKKVWMGAALTALVAAPGVARAGWVIEWKSTPVRKEVRQDSQRSTAYIEDNKMKMEQERIVTVYDYDKQRFTVLNPSTRFFWSGSVDDYVLKSATRRQQQLAKSYGSKKSDDALPELDPDDLPEVTVELSGETKEIAGYQTTKYVVKINEELFQEMWVAPELDLTDDIDPKKYVEYQQKTSRGMIGASSKPFNAMYRSPAYLDLLRKGFALETSTNHIAGSFEQSARSVRKSSVDSSSFEAPKDYRRVRLDDVFKMPEEE